MFKKNCCPGCGAVTGWLAGEMCSARCKDRMSLRARALLPSREDIIPLIDRIDAESQKLAPKSSAHAYLLTIATELRVLKQEVRKLPYEVVPSELLYKVKCLIAKYDASKQDIETRFEATRRKKPTDDVTPDEWLQMRPLTDFEKAARAKPDFKVGGGAALQYESSIVERVTKIMKTYENEIQYPYQDQDPDRVAQVFKRDMARVGQRPKKVWDPKERRLYLTNGIDALLQEQRVRYTISQPRPGDEKDQRIYVCIFPGGMSGVEYLVPSDTDPEVELTKFAKALAETMNQASPYAPSKETAVGSRFDGRTSKIAVQGKYDAASGAHLDRLAKMIGLERVGRSIGKLEDDASLRTRMYAYDYARGGGTNAPIPPEPPTPEQKIAREELRGARQAGRFAAY